MFRLGECSEHNSEGRCICAVDEEYINPECPVTVHRDAMAMIAFSPDGKRIVSASIRGFVKIWDVVTRAEVSSFVGVR